MKKLFFSTICFALLFTSLFPIITSAKVGNLRAELPTSDANYYKVWKTVNFNETGYVLGNDTLSTTEIVVTHVYCDAPLSKWGWKNLELLVLKAYKLCDEENKEQLLDTKINNKTEHFDFTSSFPYLSETRNGKKLVAKLVMDGVIAISEQPSQETEPAYLLALTLIVCLLGIINLYYGIPVVTSIIHLITVIMISISLISCMILPYGLSIIIAIELFVAGIFALIALLNATGLTDDSKKATKTAKLCSVISISLSIIALISLLILV